MVHVMLLQGIVGYDVSIVGYGMVYQYGMVCQYGMMLVSQGIVGYDMECYISMARYVSIIGYDLVYRYVSMI